MRMLYGELIYIPVIWLLYVCVAQQKKKFRTQNLILATWILVPFLFFTFVKTKKQGYTLFASPGLFILIASFFYFIKKKRELFESWKKIGLNIVLFLLIALPVRYSIERLKPFENVHRNPKWNQQVQSLQRYTVKGPNAIFLNVDRYIEAMFYTQATVYPGIPDPNQFEILQESKRPLYIINSTDLPTYTLHSKAVSVIDYTAE